MSRPYGISRAEAARIAFRASFDLALECAAYGKACGNVAVDPKGGREATLAASALNSLGYVQIDTISVVERAHHHVLWSRTGGYRPEYLDILQSEPRKAFEYWAHAAAYLPLGDYRYCLPRMRRIAQQGHEWFPHDKDIVAAVLERIRAEGPLRSQDFESHGPRGPWWDWKPAKAALEFLFHSGELMVRSRPGFQKLYDLRERVLPPETDTRYPDDEEMADHYICRGIHSLGVFTLRDLAYMRKDGTGSIKAALERAIEREELIALRVEGSTMAWWADPRLLGGEAGAAMACRPVRFLSPFDNMIIDRARALRIFGLDYTLECYVPKEKRRFGYFSLPVFRGETPIGLIDCKAERAASVLRVQRCRLFDEDIGPDAASGMPDAILLRSPEGFREEFMAELTAFASFNGCDTVSFSS